jgi:hypothetical protein
MRPRLESFDRRAGTELRSATRCAVALTVSCLLMLACIWIVNADIRDKERMHRERLAWVERTGSMMGKTAALRARSPFFYEGYMLVVKNGGGAKRTALRDFRFDPVTGEIKWLPTNDERIGPTGESFPDWGLTPGFGDSIVQALKAPVGSARTKENAEQLIRTELRSGEGDDRRTAKTDDFDDEDVAAVLRVFAVQEWPTRELAEWIVYSCTASWLWCADYKHDSGASYVERAKSEHWAYEDELAVLLTRLLRTRNLEEASALMKAQWSRAVDLARETAEPPAGAAGGAIARVANGILIAGGPVMLALQILFCIFWRRTGQGAPWQRACVGEARFPTVRSLRDPCARTDAANGADRLDRGIWAAYLTLPVVVLTFGILLRYEFPDLHLLHSSSLYLGLAAQRISDVSWIVDGINLLCLAGYIGLLLRMTGDIEAAPAESVAQSRRILRDLTFAKIRSPVGFLLVVAVLFFVLGGHLLLEFQIHERTIMRLAPSLAYFITYAGVWLWAIWRAEKSHSRYVKSLAAWQLALLFVMPLVPIL